MIIGIAVKYYTSNEIAFEPLGMILLSKIWGNDWRRFLPDYVAEYPCFWGILSNTAGSEGTNSASANVANPRFEATVEEEVASSNLQ